MIERARLSRESDPHGTPQRYVYIGTLAVYTEPMSKHLIDLDENALHLARVELGTRTIRDTVNEALRQATAHRESRLAAMLDTLSNARLDDRADAWR